MLSALHTIISLAVVALLVSNLPAPAAQSNNQQPSPVDQTPSLHANVRQVLVPVVVTDKQGHYVTDLKPSDFRVFENGTPETIVAFYADNSGTPAVTAPSKSAPAAAEAKTASPQPEPSANPKRTYLVLIDTLHSSFGNFSNVRKALTKFFEREQSPDSRYSLMTIGRDLQVVQDSTPDPALILSALRSQQFQKSILQSETNNTSVEVSQFTGLVGAYCAACGCQGITPSGEAQLACPQLTARVRSTLIRVPERNDVLDQGFLQQLKRLVNAMASMPTARTVIFLSDGFNRFPGQELYGIFQAAMPNERSFAVNPRDTHSEFDAILRIAVRYDVKFYTLDSRGLYTNNSFAGSSLDVSNWGTPSSAIDNQTMATARANTDALSALAHETGGLFFENNNDLLKGLRRAFSDGRQYYTLAYVPVNKNFDGKYRTIHVEVKGKGMLVHAKPGYWATN